MLVLLKGVPSSSPQLETLAVIIAIVMYGAILVGLVLIKEP